LQDAQGAGGFREAFQTVLKRVPDELMGRVDLRKRTIPRIVTVIKKQSNRDKGLRIVMLLVVQADFLKQTPVNLWIVIALNLDKKVRAFALSPFSASSIIFIITS
jgi:hypothetical protein